MDASFSISTSYFLLIKEIKNAMQVIGLRDVIPPPLRREFSDVYIATELMDTDLHQIIRSNQGLSEDHCQVNSSPARVNAFMDTVFVVSRNNNFYKCLVCSTSCISFSVG